MLCCFMRLFRVVDSQQISCEREVIDQYTHSNDEFPLEWWGEQGGSRCICNAPHGNVYRPTAEGLQTWGWNWMQMRYFKTYESNIARFSLHMTQTTKKGRTSFALKLGSKALSMWTSVNLLKFIKAAWNEEFF